MEQQHHKRQKNHIFIVTSDAVDAGVKQIRIRSWLVKILVLVVCVAFGAFLGLIYYEGSALRDRRSQAAMHAQELERLEQEKIVLEQKNTALESKVAERDELIRVLSDTINKKTQNENLLTEQLEKQMIPTEFPLTGSATMEVLPEGDPMCVFAVTDGAMVIATAKGTVTAVNNDVEFGHNVWIDHGNGYVTIYRNAGELKAKQGETVMQGTTLFLTDENSSKLGYQVMKDGVYINPMEILIISG